MQPRDEAFGFAIHGSEILFGGHFIAMLSGDGAARKAGLRLADRIIEVDFVNVTNENYVQVAERIELAKKTRVMQLLVADEFTDEYFASRSMTITSRVPNIVDCEEQDSKSVGIKSSGSKYRMSDSLSQRLRHSGPSTVFKEARDRLRGAIRKDQRRSMSRSSMLNDLDSRKENSNADTVSINESVLNGFTMRRQESLSSISTVNDQQSVCNYDEYGNMGVLNARRTYDNSVPTDCLDDDLESKNRVQIGTIQEDPEPGPGHIAENDPTHEVVRPVPHATTDLLKQRKFRDEDSTDEFVLRRLNSSEKDDKLVKDKSNRRRFKMFSRISEAKLSDSNF